MASPVMCTDADIRLNDLVFNRIDDAGCRWFVEDIDGWWGLPAGNVPSSPLSIFQDGSDYVSGRWLAREMILTGRLVPVRTLEDQQAVLAARRDLFLSLNTIRSFSVLEVDEPDGSKRSVVQVVGRPQTSFDQRNNVLKFSVALRAVDPRKYSLAETVVSTVIYTTPGGRSYNRTYPWNYGVSGSIGTLSINNLGSINTPGILAVQGPVINPRVELLETGEALEFAIELTASDILTIDLSTRTVVLNGTASRRGTLTADSTWFTFPPGVTTLRYNGLPQDIPATSNLTVTYRSAWLE